ncbi:hypothetical protein GO308_18260 [Sphingomonas sp. SFZ2018-12]|uniref:hypothetical protein n=1 Tax=Sphingomonas sp. SFZ2018-12 TaxID=2683197 RepID=UPI001F111EB3|nr:hypothetical protein [Sphingomonas sp. SFZ2018-12]MCH4895047.1 hypothetical protein [Sphingomonas sp. SFZ2018-12]
MLALGVGERMMGNPAMAGTRADERREPANKPGAAKAGVRSAIKRALDPAGILDPGKIFAPGIAADDGISQ